MKLKFADILLRLMKNTGIHRKFFDVSAMQAERNTGILSSRHIFYVDRFNHIQDDIAVHDMDRHLATISTSLVSDLLVENIICKV